LKCSPARESARFIINGEHLTVLLATSEDAIARAAGTTMERHPVQSAERAPAAEQPSGAVCGRQRVAPAVQGK
jgi:hypothetical protein